LQPFKNERSGKIWGFAMPRIARQNIKEFDSIENAPQKLATLALMKDGMSGAESEPLCEAYFPVPNQTIPRYNELIPCSAA
jgi:hypothetical protein